MSREARMPAPTPMHGVKADDLRPGRYELVRGEVIMAMSSGGDNARGLIAGGQVLDTDPLVEEAGFDAGYKLDVDLVRAPDIAVGNVPDKRGWINGVPSLAIEYAGRGQDEEQLQDKIAELLARGTRWVWVVRLLGPRRVEVYDAGGKLRTFTSGDVLSAPGVLKNDVPVEALFDRNAAHEATLRNLLNRWGYKGLEDVLREGREEGREQGLEEARGSMRALLLDILGRRGFELTESHRARVSAEREVATLTRWIRAASEAATVEEVFV